MDIFQNFFVCLRVITTGLVASQLAVTQEYSLHTELSINNSNSDSAQTLDENDWARFLEPNRGIPHQHGLSKKRG